MTTNRQTVAEAMSTKVITIDKSSSGFEAAKKLLDHGIGCVVVVGPDSGVLGVITKGDILREAVMKKLDPDKVSVREIMSQPAITITPDAPLANAADIMSKNNVTKLPVVSGDKLVGIITSTDLLKNKQTRDIYSKDYI